MLLASEEGRSSEEEHPKGIKALPAAAGPGAGAVPATSKATPATTATPTTTIFCTTPLCLPVELLLSKHYSKIQLLGRPIIVAATPGGMPQLQRSPENKESEGT